MNSNSWQCFTCKEVFQLIQYDDEGELIVDQPGGEKEEQDLIHVQCANCLRIARYHRIEHMTYVEQIKFKLNVESE